jgi:hypothetical protein
MLVGFLMCKLVMNQRERISAIYKGKKALADLNPIFSLLPFIYRWTEDEGGDAYLRLLLSSLVLVRVLTLELFSPNPYEKRFYLPHEKNTPNFNSSLADKFNTLIHRLFPPRATSPRSPLHVDKQTEPTHPRSPRPRFF